MRKSLYFWNNDFLSIVNLDQKHFYLLFISTWTNYIFSFSVLTPSFISIVHVNSFKVCGGSMLEADGHYLSFFSLFVVLFVRRMPGQTSDPQQKRNRRKSFQCSSTVSKLQHWWIVVLLLLCFFRQTLIYNQHVLDLNVAFNVLCFY